MSLAIAVKGPDGIVLATDSRRVLKLGEWYATMDDEEKLWAFPAPQTHVGAVFYGYGRFGCRLAPLHDAFAAELPSERLSVEEVARRLGGFLDRSTDRLIAIVGGVDEDGTGRVFAVDPHEHPEPIEQHAGGVGISWGGQREFVDRLLQGYDARLSEALDGAEGLDTVAMKIPLDRITLHGVLELARFLIETTVGAQRHIEGICGVGGPIHLATITSEGFRWVQREAGNPKPEWNEIIEVPAAVVEAPADGVGVATYAAASDSLR